MEFSRDAGMMMENKRNVCSLEESSIKRHKSDLSFNSKERKDKVGERISALQQIVSPYGKTDTASVLLDAMHYIEFLHDQVKVLSAPYLQTMSAATQTDFPVVITRRSWSSTVCETEDYVLFQWRIQELLKATGLISGPP